MTASRYDLWLVEANRVYRGVPYEVLADWLQQGRVGPNDRLRLPGEKDWQLLDNVPTLAVYLPRADDDASNDKAEALAPVELDIAIRRPRQLDDDDVDMIPLIDISLVLLIFFMMTATVAVGGAGIDVPQTQYSTLTSDRSMLWVGMDIGPERQPVFSIGEGDSPATPADEKLSQSEVIDRVKQRLARREAGQGMIVRVAAHRRLPVETVQDLTAELTKLRPLGLVQVKAEVTEQSP